MKHLTRRIVAGCVLMGTLLISGCTQMPTENSGVVDMRPRISFSVENESLLAARVTVDALDAGALADYIAGKTALRVTPGNHRVQVRINQLLVLDEQVYLGDGVGRVFLVK